MCVCVCLSPHARHSTFRILLVSRSLYFYMVVNICAFYGRNRHGSYYPISHYLRQHVSQLVCALTRKHGKPAYFEVLCIHAFLSFLSLFHSFVQLSHLYQPPKPPPPLISPLLFFFEHQERECSAMQCFFHSYKFSTRRHRTHSFPSLQENFHFYVKIFLRHYYNFSYALSWASQD